MANDDPSPVPGAGRHLLVLGCAYLLGVPAYLLSLFITVALAGAWWALALID